MNILFRVDSSSTIGTGHVMRDLVLAEQYSKANITFATQKLDGNINYKIKESKYKIEILKSNDIKELVNLIKKLNIDMIIIDHYCIDYTFEKKLKEKKTNLIILSFDDTYEKHYSDILLNHNISADINKYKGLVPSHCELRCGSRYTLLRKEFFELKKNKTKNRNDKFIFFVAIGGSDILNLNPKILEVLSNFINIEVNIVTTRANQNLNKLEIFCKDKKWVNLHIETNNIAALMINSDFAIITPSVTLNEVYFLGLPFIAIKVADNQMDMYEFLEKKNYTVLEKFDRDKLRKYIKDILCKK